MIGWHKPGKPSSRFLPLTVLLLLSLFFWIKIVFLGRALVFGFTLYYFYPIYTFLSDAVRSNIMPLWNPFVHGGAPFLANPQTAVYYPLSYIFAFLPFPEALGVHTVLHTFLAGLFMYWLAGDLGMKRTASLGAAIMFMFNGFFVFHFEFATCIASYVWIPLVFMFYRRAARSGDVADIAAAAVFLALQFFAGYPQYVYYTFGLLALYSAMVTVKKENFIKDISRVSGVFLQVFALFALVSAAQLLPAFELALNSVRGSGLDAGAVLGYSLRPLDMLKFFVFPLWDWMKPFYDGDPHIIGLYFGITGLLAAGYSVLRKKTAEEKFFACVFVLALLLALGKYFPLYGIFYDYAPGWKYFRFPAQAGIIAVFCFSLIFGYGIGKIGGRALRAALLTVVFAELFVFGLRANLTVDRSFYDIETPGIRFLRGDPGMFRFILAPAARKADSLPGATPIEHWLNYKDMLYPNTGMAYFLFDADSQETLRVASYDRLIDSIHSPTSVILDMLNVKYVFLDKKITDNNLALARDGHIKIYENRNYLQRFFLVPRAAAMPRDEVLKYMASDGFNPRKEVVLDETAGKTKYFGKETGGSPADIVTINNYSINRIDLNVSAKRPGWLVMSETYYPGWKVEVDGERAEIYRANYALRAVPVLKGVHNIVMRYEPWTVKAGQLISLVSIFGLLGVLALYLRRRLYLK
ncbi:MAG: YfhO family protein [Elusimicrobiota bacterium]